MLYGRADVQPYIENFCNTLLDDRPNVVGFSVLFKSQFLMAVLMARIVKALDASVKVVFGGPYVGDEDAIQQLLEFGFADFVVLKEGEQSLVALLDALEGDGDFSGVPGIAYNVNNQVKKNPSAPPLNLTDLPFLDFSDLDLDSYFTPSPVIPILTSRGCFWRRCTFCNHWSLFGNSYKVPSVERIVDEIEHHVNNGISYFDIVDEMVAPSRFRKIGEEIIRRGLKINYFALAMPTKNFDKETLGIMSKSGCSYILWGFESGSQRILDLIQKGTVVEDVQLVLEEANEVGIRNHLFTMVGFPTETTDDLQKTLDFLYENQTVIDTIMPSQFVLTKDAQVYSHLEDYNITKVTDVGSQIVEYEVSTGIDSRQAKKYHQYYTENFFPDFSYFTWMNSFFRQHTLIHYANIENLKFTSEAPTILKPQLEMVI